MKTRFILFIIFVIIAGIFDQCTSAKRNDSGNISESGDVGVKEIRVGDCFSTLPSNNDQFASVKGVPCTQAHRWEVISTGLITGVSEYSEGIVNTEASRICDPDFNSLILSLDEFKLNEYRNIGTAIILPTYSSWNKNNRAVRCLIGNDNEIYYTSILD